jgi:hypothetical protein
MAGEHNAESSIKTFKAGGAISARHAVKYSDVDTVVIATATNATGIYMGDDDAASGDYISVCILGPVKAMADGSTAITAGNTLAPDASGHLVKDVTATHVILAEALEDLASGTGIIEVMVLGPVSV